MSEEGEEEEAGFTLYVDAHTDADNSVAAAAGGSGTASVWDDDDDVRERRRDRTVCARSFNASHGRCEDKSRQWRKRLRVRTHFLSWSSSSLNFRRAQTRPCKRCLYSACVFF